MRKCWLFLVLLFELFVPRMVEEDVVVVEVADGWLPIQAVASLEPGEYVRAVVRMRSLSWLGSGWWPRQVGDVRYIGRPYQGVPF